MVSLIEAVYPRKNSGPKGNSGFFISDLEVDFAIIAACAPAINILIHKCVPSFGKRSDDTTEIWRYDEYPKSSSKSSTARSAWSVELGSARKPEVGDDIVWLKEPLHEEVETTSADGVKTHVSSNGCPATKTQVSSSGCPAATKTQVSSSGCPKTKTQVSSNGCPATMAQVTSSGCPAAAAAAAKEAEDDKQIRLITNVSVQYSENGSEHLHQ